MSAVWKKARKLARFIAVPFAEDETVYEERGVVSILRGRAATIPR